MNKQLEFINKEMYHNKRLILELMPTSIDDNFIIEISDFTMKDGAIQHDWIPPRIVVDKNGCEILCSGSGNPKYKEYSKEEFLKIFKYK